MVNAIDEVTLAIAQSQTAILEYQQALQQLKWEQFDLLQEQISMITEEANFLIGLMSNKKLYDDNGKFTDEGMATIGLHGVNYNTLMHQADLVAAEIKRLEAEIAADPFDMELQERYREMIALQQEYILAAEDEKNAIRDMVEEGINLELDALQERIDLYNEALQSQKDLYDYQKRVKEQTEEIASLEKQMAAYAGDDSEEAKTKIQELKVSLEEARENLEETEYEKYIEDQQKLLDSLYDQYSEILNSRLDNIDALMESMIAEINTNASTISDTLHEAAGAVGAELSDSMTTIWDGAGDVLTKYGDQFSANQTNIKSAIDIINANLQSIIAHMNAQAAANAAAANNSSAADTPEANTQPDPKPEPPPAPEPEPEPEKEIKVGGKINAGNAPIYDYAGDTSGETQYFSNDPIYTVLKEQNGYLLTRHHKLTSGYTGWFKKSDVKAYKTGVQKLDYEGVAWTQENGGREFIVRPSDGAILTPVAKGDSVLNAEATKNIWDMANNPSDFVRDNLQYRDMIMPNGNVASTYPAVTQNLERVVFNLPNVKNYEELLSEMQKDKNFERLINSMTIDRLAGKSGLAKGKSVR